MPQSIEPACALQPSAKQAIWGEHARKGQHPRDDDERRVEISTRNREEGTRTQDGELGKQQDSGYRIVHEHRRGISRDEGVDPPELDGRERTLRDRKGDQQGEHDGDRKSSLRLAGRQAREDKMRFLR